MSTVLTDAATVNTQEILKACEVLGWFSEQGIALAEDRSEGLSLALHMNVARLYLLEYLKHGQKGAEPYDALLSAARGEMSLGPRRAEMVRTIVEQPNGFSGGTK